MKRALIYGFFNFPRMSANANYAQYLALALKEIGYEVAINSPADIRKCEKKGSAFFYKGIRVLPIDLRTNKISHYLDYQFGLGNYFIKAIDEFCLQKGDIVIGYIPDGRAIDKVIRVCKQREIIVCHCIDEMFEDSIVNEMPYIRRSNYKRALYKSLLNVDYIFPISTYIQDFYSKLGKKTFVIPIMADCNEYDTTHYSQQDTVKIIYPANGMIKENFTDMIRGISCLPADILNKLEVHLTGIKRNIFEKYGLEEMLKKLQKNLVLHEWLEYEQLIELYRRMDYLLLVREKSRTTLANFPSKIPEAMTYGVVPICSKVGDYTKLYLKDRVNCIMIDGCSADKCCNAVSFVTGLTKEERIELSNNAKRCVEEKFDYHIWVPKLMRYFETEGLI